MNFHFTYKIKTRDTRLGKSYPLFIFLCLVFGFVGNIHAQSQILDIPIEKLSIRGQVKSASVLSLTIDPFGFMWYASRDGLFKYEGNQLKSFYHIHQDSTSLPSNNVRQVHADQQGNIYANAYGSPLHVMLRRNERFYPVKPNSSEHQIADLDGEMVSDSNNITWIATDEGICACKILDKIEENPSFEITCNWPEKHPLSALNGVQVSHLMMTKDHKIWLTDETRIMEFNPYGEGSLDTLLDEEDKIMNLFQSTSGDNYILTTGRDPLFKWDKIKRSWEYISGFELNGENTYREGAVDEDGNYWISELGYGMHLLTSDSKYTFLSSDRTSSIYSEFKYGRKPATDQVGNIWWPAGSIFKTPATQKRIRSFQEIFRNTQYVSSILREDETLWIGTLGGGILKYNLDTDSYQQFDKEANNPNALPDERIYYIQSFGADSLLILTRSYLVFFNKKTNTFYPHYISSGPVRTAVFDKNDAYLGFSNRGIIHYNFLSKKKTLIAHGKKETDVINQTNYIYRDKNNILWLGTLDGGLIKFNPSTLEFKRFLHNQKDQQSISSNSISMIVPDDKGKLWIGTNDGLNIFDPEEETFELLSKEDGLIGDRVENIIQDQSGLIWVSASDGMNSIDPKTREIKSFEYGSGLNNLVYYPRSIHMDEEGQIYIGGREGLNIFHPSEMGSNSIAPKVWITNIEREHNLSYDVPFEWLKKITLEPHEDYVNIDFASNHFTNPEANVFEYRLKGLHDKWNQLGTKNNIQLVGLKAGNYVLEIHSQTSEGLRSEKPARLEIIVEPHFYNTWWFYSILGFIVASIFFFLYKNRIAQLEKESLYKQTISAIEMKALRSQMNPHFIFNSLNSIKSYIVDNKPRIAANYLTKFAQLMRHILNHSKVDEISLKEELAALELYMELEKIRFSKQFDYKIQVAETIHIESILTQPLIIQPFVENAIWHGLMHQEKQGYILISLSEHKSKLLIEIDDNGIGRKKAQEKKSKSAEKTKSYGMEITLERLRTKYDDAFSIEIIDKTNDEGIPSGTTIQLIIPKITKA